MATKSKEDPKIAAKRKLAEEQKSTLKALEPQAVEINERLERAAKASGQAVDMRVAAAIVLGKVKASLQAAKLDFAEWCDKNVKKFGGYENCRKLASAGASGDVKKTTLAIADMRERNAAAQKRGRAKRKAVTRHPSDGSNIGTDPAPISSPKMTPFKVADAALKEMGDKGVELIRSHAGKHGLELVNKTVYDKLRPVMQAIDGDGLDGIKVLFKALSATDQIAFVEWAGKELGFEVNNPLKASTSAPEADAPIPAFLDRKNPEVAAAAAGAAPARRVRRK